MLTGHQCRHVADIGMASASDEAIVREAKQQGELIITHDLDYGNLLAFSGDSAPSVVIVRLRNTQPQRLLARIASVLAVAERPLHDGAIVIVEDATVRIRRLP
ncbi:MAG: DUF5615 family PIN-like protein, partial [Anaerolineae bacterium]